jgi:hypothetical protein
LKLFSSNNVMLGPKALMWNCDRSHIETSDDRCGGPGYLFVDHAR